MDIVLYICFFLISAAILMIFFRLLTGPTLIDRIVALDLFITASIGMISAYSIFLNQTIFLDVVVIMTLLAFLGTVAFSFYYEKQDKL